MFNYFIISQGFVNESFSIILQGIEYDFIPVFTLSHIIIPSFLSQLSINFHFTIIFNYYIMSQQFEVNILNMCVYIPSGIHTDNLK